MKSELRYDNIRNPANGKATTVLSGNGFVHVFPLPDGPSLQRIAYCGWRKCRILRYGQSKSTQEVACKRCWETGLIVRNCQNEKLCKVCKKADHEPGSDICEFFKAQVDRVVTFNGHKTALSNIFPSELKVNGETHSFVEHACQLTKVLHLRRYKIGGTYQSRYDCTWRLNKIGDKK